jgi:hypothetical protein
MGSEMASVAPPTTEVLMVEAEAVRQMRDLASKGWGAKRIARELGVAGAIVVVKWNDGRRVRSTRRSPRSHNTHGLPVRRLIARDARSGLAVTRAGLALTLRRG